MHSYSQDCVLRSPLLHFASLLPSLIKHYNHYNIQRQEELPFSRSFVSLSINIIRGAIILNIRRRIATETFRRTRRGLRIEEVVQGQTRTRLMEQAGFTTRGKDGLRRRWHGRGCWRPRAPFVMPLIFIRI